LLTKEPKKICWIQLNNILFSALPNLSLWNINAHRRARGKLPLRLWTPSVLLGCQLHERNVSVFWDFGEVFIWSFLKLDSAFESWGFGVFSGIKKVKIWRLKLVFVAINEFFAEPWQKKWFGYKFPDVRFLCFLDD
jgi:hypothetical protein